MRKSLSTSRRQAKAAENPRHSWAWQKLRRQVLPKPGAYPCHWCGRPATEVDHLIPVVAGGTDALANLVPACRACNRSRGAKSVEEWHARQAPRPRAYGAPTPIARPLPLRSFATIRGDFTRKPE